MLSSVFFHKDFASLRIATHEIGILGVKIDQVFSKDAISCLIAEPNKQEFSWQALDQSHLIGQIERENDHCFKVTLTISLNLKTTCVRCLHQLTQPFYIDFSLRMIEKEHLGFAEHESEADLEIDMSNDEEDSVGYFLGTCIDVGLILRDQIFFSIPDYPHCENAGCQVPKSPILEPSGLDHSNGRGNNPFAKLLKKA